jgi:hypothetical protein
MERVLEAAHPICNEEVHRERPAGEAYPDAFHGFSRINVSFVCPLEIPRSYAWLTNIISSSVDRLSRPLSRGC